MFHMKHFIVLLDLFALSLGIGLAIAFGRCRRKLERMAVQLSRAKFECAVVGARLEALQMLFNEKQGKIDRLQAAVRAGIRAGPGDLVPERRLRSIYEAVREVSRDFDRRQREYERTGRYDRRTDHLTETPDDTA